MDEMKDGARTSHEQEVLMQPSQQLSPISHAGVLHIRLLGGFEVAVDEQIIPDDAWRLRRASTLIKLLALAPGHRLARDQVLELLWPRMSPEAARNNLHQALYAARRALKTKRGGPQFIRLHHDLLVLDAPNGLLIDVDAFECACTTARMRQDVATLQRAVGFYTGDLLPADRYEDWVVARRTALRESYLDLLLRLATLHQQADDLDKAISTLRQAIDHEPTYELAHTQLIGLLEASGQHYAARRQYHVLRDMLRRALDTDFEDDVSAILEEPHELGQASSYRDVVAPPRTGNLPLALTSLVGRQTLIADVCGLLRTTRMVSLVGPGGVGKTRLALEAARQSALRYPGSVWFVSLGALQDPALVPDAVARTLGVSEGLHRSVTASIAAEIDNDTLIVLDNCEHLIDACAQLCHTVLEQSPGVRILATSREALGVPGETVWRVPPLTLPTPPCPSHQDPDLEMVIEQSEAVQLFLERAALRQPRIELTVDNSALLVTICRRLDGIPLAIELAAARTSILTLSQIATRLDSALELLHARSRTLEARQQSVRAVLDWSYDLLSGEERAAFRHTAVFVGGFTLASFEAVLSIVSEQKSAKRNMSQGIDLLAQLVEKSLVQVETRDDQNEEARYCLLETVQQYAAERLIASDEYPAACERHAQWFLSMVEDAEPHLARADSWWWERIDREHGNLRAALDWAVSANEHDIAMRFVGALWQYWQGRGYLREGRHAAERALARFEGRNIPDALKARAFDGAGTLAWRQGDNERAQALLEDALDIHRTLGDQRGMAHALHYLGAVAHHRGDFAAAARLYQESLVLRRALDDRSNTAALLNNLGLAVLALGDAERAEALLQESLALHQELGDRWNAAYTLDSLGQAALARNNPYQARGWYIAALTLLRDLDDRWCAVASIVGFAATLLVRREFRRAAVLLGAAQHAREQMGVDVMLGKHHPDDALVDELRAQLGASAFTAAFIEGRSLSVEQAILVALRDQQLRKANEHLVPQLRFR
jgi:predicted ATPase/DNA-binding SARP family transcriptional activator